jgi:hypothetical protein
MSELGDSFREMRDRRREARRHYHDCPNCVFGGNARKVAPGDKCFHCGWQTPEYEKKRQEFGRKALRLKAALFGEGHSVDAPGFVGVGEREFIVYLHCSKRKWKGSVHETWEGTPVKYKFNIGPIVAFGETA